MCLISKTSVILLMLFVVCWSRPHNFDEEENIEKERRREYGDINSDEITLDERTIEERIMNRERNVLEGDKFDVEQLDEAPMPRRQKRNPHGHGGHHGGSHHHGHGGGGYNYGYNNHYYNGHNGGYNHHHGGGHGYNNGHGYNHHGRHY